MPRATPPESSRQGPPSSLPEGNPPAASMDHSWTLQAIMQMQKDLGVFGEKIDRMRDDFAEAKSDGAKTRDKLGDVEKSIASANGALKVFGRLYALLLVVVAAFLAWFLRPTPQVVLPDAQPSAVQQQGVTGGDPSLVAPPAGGPKTSSGR
jgi:hypothetical protein